ncbi:hypothetical protein HELRODRAFT_159084 [Helobdella robusta]|uniref:Uncharacterized protein n=1 Tax=Helobdella robusta TaxID=6412 RepID=T1ENK4_HELRO|nr:hypothetical protein HELRODRAFT_159084 [Helobdella robusta]ESO12528.1 hypothetical protein HELRODRAFT_159084 [Helobdella robusta]
MSTESTRKLFQFKQRPKFFSKFKSTKVSDISEESFQNESSIYLKDETSRKEFKKESDSDSKASKSSKSTTLTAASSIESDLKSVNPNEQIDGSAVNYIETMSTNTVSTIEATNKRPTLQRLFWKSLVKKHKKTILGKLREQDLILSMDSTDQYAKRSEYKSGEEGSDRHREESYEDFKHGKKNDKDRRVMLDADFSRSGDTYIRSAIPYLPKKVAVICLILNLIIPGSGTIFSGLLVLICGQPRMGSKDGIYASTLCVNVAVGSMQLLTVPFFFVGWIWSLVWGIYIILLADLKFTFLPDKPMIKFLNYWKIHNFFNLNVEEKQKIEKEQYENQLRAKALSAFDPKFRMWTAPFPRFPRNFANRWILRSALNFVSDGEVVASAREQDNEIYETRNGHEQLDEQQS